MSVQGITHSPLFAAFQPTAPAVAPAAPAQTGKASEVDAEKVLQYANDIKATFNDGFQLTDIFVVISKAVDIVKEFQDFPEAERKSLAIMIVDKVIDETDGPGPDAIIDPILKAVVPFVIDMVADFADKKA